jgi:tetratricopeptide (TPR) repeat protein
MLGESALISGDIEYAMNIQKILLEDARRRRSPLHQCWGLLGVAANNIRLGNAAAAVPMLEEALQILEETPNLASSIEINGQLALAYLRLGEEEKALASADKVLALAANISPTVYSMNIGFTAVADVYFELWEKALQNPDKKFDADKLKELAEKAVSLLRAFEKVFPIGQPNTPLYQGWYEWLIGNHEKAIKSLHKGLEAAQKFNMPYEEGLIRIKLASYAQDPSETRKNHIRRAIEIFEKMGAIRELRLAQQEAKKAEI